MPKGKRNVETKVRRPLLRIERIIYEKASFKMNRDVLANIEQYVLYIKEVTGDEPTQDEIVDRGMQRLFDADRGFRQWLQRKADQNENVSRAQEVGDVVKRTSVGVSSEKHQSAPSDRIKDLKPE
ncbi:MAG: hypothetical protein L0226_13640 [Acidobacteria bacterium]|nr:hypothetical protein [Acidobacteriota bacterium]MCI0662367.1 hypothetical protein [Acidobacteriota bacterium]